MKKAEYVHYAKWLNKISNKISKESLTETSSSTVCGKIETELNKLIEELKEFFPDEIRFKRIEKSKFSAWYGSTIIDYIESIDEVFDEVRRQLDVVADLDNIRHLTSAEEKAVEYSESKQYGKKYFLPSVVTNQQKFL
jgi:RNA binding exosome subunit